MCPPGVQELHCSWIIDSAASYRFYIDDSWTIDKRICLPLITENFPQDQQLDIEVNTMILRDQQTVKM